MGFTQIDNVPSLFGARQDDGVFMRVREVGRQRLAFGSPGWCFSA